MTRLVVLSGLPGVGKSTVARALAARSNALWLRVDAIEHAMRGSAMAVRDIADGGYAAMRAVASGALRQGFRVVADAVNPLPVTRDPWLEVAREAGSGLSEVELVCGDLMEHRRRVEAREAEVPGLALPDWAAVKAREYRAWTRPVLRVDTGEMTVEAAAGRIMEAMEWRS